MDHNIDTADDSSQHRIERLRRDGVTMTAMPHPPNAPGLSQFCGDHASANISVLIIVGIPLKSINRALALVAGQCSSDGIAVDVFECLGHLPPYSETLEGSRTPDSVVALRTAAAKADAALIVTKYHGRVPAMVHTAIDWLTRRWHHSGLHGKPVAVIGRAAGCYSGVWSRHQRQDAEASVGPLVVESITVATLREAVTKLAGEVSLARDPSGATGTTLQLHKPAMDLEH
jgi:NAD(P)H-dependent FMN reductase